MTLEKLWTTASVAHAVELGKQALRGVGAEAPAVVFDVDDTLLTNHSDDDGRFRANKPVVDLLNFALEGGARAYIVTARRKSPWSYEYLKKQLRAIGVDPARMARIYMLPAAYDADGSASRFKRDARRRIATLHGGQILLNVGDQLSDMSLCGPFATDGAPGKALLSDYCYGLSGGEETVLSIKLPSHYVVK